MCAIVWIWINKIKLLSKIIWYSLNPSKSIRLVVNFRSYGKIIIRYCISYQIKISMKKKRTCSSILKAAIVASFITTAMPVMAETLDLQNLGEGSLPVSAVQTDGNDTNTYYLDNINTDTDLVTDTDSTSPIVLSMNKVMNTSSQVVDQSSANAMMAYFGNTSDGTTITIDGNTYTSNNEPVMMASSYGVMPLSDDGETTTGTIYDYINGTIAPEDKTFTMTQNITVTENLGDLGVSELIIDGADGSYSIDGSGFSGINTLSSALTIQNVGSVDGEGNIVNSINGFVSGENGGAIDNDGTTTINNATFSENTAGSGGAIYNKSITTINNSIFSDNTASSSSSGGGAIYNSATTTINNSTFSDNSASTNGGAIYNYGSSAKLSITDSSFKGNKISIENTASKSIYGGAIYNGGTLEIINSDFDGNALIATSSSPLTADGKKLFGGAISTGGTTTITDSSFTNNTLSATNISGLGLYGGAIYFFSDTADKKLTINAINKDVLFDNNKAGDEYNDITIDAGTANLNAYNDKSITFNGGINDFADEPTYTKTLNINKDENATGTIVFNADVTGTNFNVNLYNGTLQLGSKGNGVDTSDIGAKTVSGLNIFGGTLSLENNVLTDNVAINSISDVANLIIDVDFASGSSDKISLAGDGAIKITDLNILNDTTASSIQITISDAPLHSLANTIITTAYKYDLAESTTGIIDITKSVSKGLYDAIRSVSASEYKLTANDIAPDDLGEMITDELTINPAGNYSINGDNHAGMSIAEGKTLNINGVGRLNDDGSVDTSITGFVKTDQNGGFVDNSGVLNVKNSVFNDNEGVNGGAIYNSGTANVNNTYLTSNNAGSNAGAIYNVGDLSLNDSVFNNNGAAADGGAIYNEGSANLTNVEFFDNGSVANGGAVYNTGDLLIKDSDFLANISESSAGAIYNAGTATITDTTFSENEAQNGGAIYNTGTATITDTSFENNIASENGGAIYNTGTATITDTSFENNIASENGGAIYNTGTLNLIAQEKELVFSGNKVGNETDGYTNNAIYNDGGTVNLSAKKDIVFNDGISGGTTGDLNINQTADEVYIGTVAFNNDVAGFENINLYNGILKVGTKDATTAVTISPLSIYGGVLDIANNLASDSIIINTISDIAKVVIDVDFENGKSDKISYSGDGAIRITNLNVLNTIPETTSQITISDSELHTLGSTIYSGNNKYTLAESTTGVVDVSFGTASGGLYEAVQDASDFVMYHLTADEVVTQNLGTLQAKELVIDGTAENQYALDMNNYAGAIVAKDHTLTLKNLNIINQSVTIKNGGKVIVDNIVFSNSNNNNNSTNAGVFIEDQYGGAYGTTIITNSIFENNNKINSSHGGVFDGNGIYKITNTYFNNNSASGSGGVMFYNSDAMARNGGSITIEDSVFTGNSATSNAGAIYNETKLDIKGSTFKENHAGNYGGAIYNTSTMKIAESTFDGNYQSISGSSSSYTRYGGAIYNTNSATITDTEFKNNYLDINNTDSWGSSTARGGAIYNTSSTTIENAIFENNTINSKGGSWWCSIYAEGGAIYYSGGTNVIVNSDFVNNAVKTAGSGNYGVYSRGGAIYNSSNLTITDSSFIDNTTYNPNASANSTKYFSSGGAIYNQSTLTINAENEDVLFINNKANNVLNDIQNTSTLNLNANENRKIHFDGSITGTGTMYINNTEGKTGVVELNGDVENTVNFYRGTLVVGKNTNSTPITINKLAMKGGSLNSANGVIDTFNLTELKDIAYDFDIDLANAQADKLGGSISAGAKVSFGNINFINPTMDSNKLEIQLASAGIVTDVYEFDLPDKDYLYAILSSDVSDVAILLLLEAL